MKRLLIVSCCVVGLIFSCSESTVQRFTLQGPAFGTTYGIAYFSDQQNPDLETALDSVFLAINNSVSTYLPNSDISKINNGNATLEIDPIFIDNFLLSKSVFEQTQGYFDPTVGTLRNAYGFGDTAPAKQLDLATIDSLRALVGFNKVQLTAKNTIAKQHPAIYLDFNAVAKGYAVDQVALMFDRMQIPNYLIEIGGEIRAKGLNLEKNQPWIVGIEAIDSERDSRSLAARVSLKDKSMASSGNYRKFRVDSATGQKYVHTINPLTGSAAKSDVTSATVFAKSCAKADAYATSFMAMGIERSLKLLPELEDVQVYLTYVDSIGDSQVYISEQLEPHLIKD